MAKFPFDPLVRDFAGAGQSLSTAMGRVIDDPTNFRSTMVTLPNGDVVIYETRGGIPRTRLIPQKLAEKIKEKLPRGIGIAFTDMDGNPVEGYSREVSPGIFEPTPLILTPKTSTTNKRRSNGAWKKTKAKKLIGGQRVWASADGKYVFSVYCNPTVVDCPGMQERLVRSRTNPTYQYRYPHLDWTPYTYNRLIIGSDANGETIADIGRYACRWNDSIVLTSAPNKYPPHVLKDEAGTYLLHAWPSGTQLVLRSRLYSVSNGLTAQPLPTLAVKDQVGPTVQTLYWDSQYSIGPDSFQVHPAGDRAIAVAFRSGYSPLYLATFTLTPGGASVSFAEIPGYKATNTPFTTGTGLRRVTTTREARFKQVQTTSWGCNDETPAVVLMTVHDDPIVTTTDTRDSTFTTDTSSAGVNRAYYNRDGEVVTEMYRQGTKATYTYDYDYNNVLTPGVGATGNQSTVIKNTYKSWASVELGKTVLNTYETDAENISTLIQVNNGTTWGTTTDTYQATAKETYRWVLFYDDRLDFAAYLEVTVTGTMDTGTKTTHTDAALVFMRQGVGVFRDTLETAGYNMEYYMRRAEIVIGTQGAGVTTTESTDYPEDKLIYEACPTGSYWSGHQELLKNQATYTLETFAQTDYPLYPKGNSYLPAIAGFSYAGSRALESYFNTEFARDPLTDALVLSITSKEPGREKNWLWVVDEVSARPLKDLLGISTDIKVWEKYNFNALVSI